MGLDEWRARIDEIDRQLLPLLNQRAQLSLEIGRAKREAGEEHFKKALKLAPRRSSTSLPA